MLRRILFIAVAAVIAGLTVITWRGHSEKARDQAPQQLPVAAGNDGHGATAVVPIAQQGAGDSTLDGGAAVANRLGLHGVAPERRQRPLLRPNAQALPRTQAGENREPVGSGGSASTRPPLPGHRLERFFNAHEIEPANRDRVLALLQNHDAESLDISELSRSRGLSARDRMQLADESFRRLSTGLEELLGRELTSDLFSFQVGQYLTDGFAAECTSRGMPLSDAAFTTITVDFQRHCLVSQPSSPALADRWPEMMRQHDELGLAIVEKVLSPQQMIEFRKFWTQRGLGYVRRR